MELIKITHLGDIMFDFELSKLKNSYVVSDKNKFDFSDCFNDVKAFLSESDYVLANLETPVSINSTDLTNEQYRFCAPFEFLEALKSSGVNYLSTANNHCLDRGIEGLVSTIDSLDKLGFDHNGTYKSTKGKKPLVIEKDGVKIGILSYTYGTNAFHNKIYLKNSQKNMVDLLQHQEEYISKINPFYYFVKYRSVGRVARLYQRIQNKLHPENIGKMCHEKVNASRYRMKRLKRDIKVLKKQADIVVAYVHVGEQLREKPSEYTLKITNFLKAKGVDITVANHEHVVHGSSCENNQITTYSIGNYFSSMGILSEPFDRLAEYSVALHTYINKKTKIIEKATFSVLKSIIDSQNKIKVVNVWDYINSVSEQDKTEEKKKMLKIASTFSGKQFDNIEKEFSLNI